MTSSQSVRAVCRATTLLVGLYAGAVLAHPGDDDPGDFDDHPDLEFEFRDAKLLDVPREINSPGPGVGPFTRSHYPVDISRPLTIVEISDEDDYISESSRLGDFLIDAENQSTRTESLPVRPLDPVGQYLSPTLQASGTPYFLYEEDNDSSETFNPPTISDHLEDAGHESIIDDLNGARPGITQQFQDHEVAPPAPYILYEEVGATDSRANDDPVERPLLFERSPARFFLGIEGEHHRFDPNDVFVAADVGRGITSQVDGRELTSSMFPSQYLYSSSSTADSCSESPSGCDSIPAVDSTCDNDGACWVDAACDPTTGTGCDTPSTTPGNVCEDGNNCIVDTCDPNSGCVDSPAETPCDARGDCLPTTDACDAGSDCLSDDSSSTAPATSNSGEMKIVAPPKLVVSPSTTGG